VVSGKIRDTALKRELGDQSERAAALEKEASEANRRTADIMKAAAWRQLTEKQRQKFAEGLPSQPGKVVIAWIANDPEPQGFAAQIIGLLEKAHWQIAISARTYSVNLIWGVFVPTKFSAADSVEALRAAFAHAEIAAAHDDIPTESMSIGGGGGPDFATVLVGSRRPNLTQPP
jgi:hypothetical protein